MICTFVAHHFERIHMFKVIFVAAKINKVKYCYTRTNACNTYGCHTRTNHTKIQLPLRYVSKREDFARWWREDVSSHKNGLLTKHNQEILFYMNATRKSYKLQERRFLSKTKRINARLHEDMQHVKLGGMLGLQNVIILPHFPYTISFIFHILSFHKPYK